MVRMLLDNNFLLEEYYSNFFFFFPEWAEGLQYKSLDFYLG